MNKTERRERRVKSIRKKVAGTSERPRLCLNKSLKNIYAQIIDDTQGKTLCGLSTKSKDIETTVKGETRKSVVAGTSLGVALAKLAVAKGIKKVVFDRTGRRYHGVVKAFADAARKGGLEF
jgi:large subunit ribosomal protein L18